MDEKSIEKILGKLLDQKLSPLNDNLSRVSMTMRKIEESMEFLRLLHTMNVRFSLLDIAQRILGVTLPNFQ